MSFGFRVGSLKKYEPLEAHLRLAQKLKISRGLQCGSRELHGYSGEYD